MAARIAVQCLWLGSLWLAGLAGWILRDLEPPAAASIVAAALPAEDIEWADPAAAKPRRTDAARPSPASPARREAVHEASPRGAVASACIEAPQGADEQDAAPRLLRAVQEGDAAARVQALLRARSAGLVLPDAIVTSLLESDPSEDVRLLAFDHYMEQRSGNQAEARSALESALYIASTAIQAEARRRLGRLDEELRPEFASAQDAAPTP